MKGRFRPRLCENESIFLTDGTAHHNDFCWRLGDAMHSHMRAHPYALNGTFLADTSETLSSALQLPVVKNKTSRKNNILMRKRVLDDTISPELAPKVHEAFSRLARSLRAQKLYQNHSIANSAMPPPSDNLLLYLVTATK